MLAIGFLAATLLVRGYQTEWGVMDCQFEGSQVACTYPLQNGKVLGELHGHEFKGIWLQSNRGVGNLNGTFSEEFRTFTGQYNDWNHKPEKWAAWNGTLIAGSTSDDFLAIERARSEAIRNHDFAALGELYVEDFVGVSSSGQKVDRKQLFDLFGRVESSIEASIEDLSVTPAGAMRIISALLTLRSAEGAIVSRARFLHVYARRDGRWRLVTGQSTALPN